MLIEAPLSLWFRGQKCQSLVETVALLEPLLLSLGPAGLPLEVLLVEEQVLETLGSYPFLFSQVPY